MASTGAGLHGFDFGDYVKWWSRTSTFLIQVESILAVENIERLLSYDEIDGVMIGPYDISGSLGVPGQPSHPLVLNASRKVIDACARRGKSCGTQVTDASADSVAGLFHLGYTYAILGSDLFVLWKWAEQMRRLDHINESIACPKGIPAMDIKSIRNGCVARPMHADVFDYLQDNPVYRQETL